MMVDTYLAAVVTLSLAVECIGQTVPMSKRNNSCLLFKQLVLLWQIVVTLDVEETLSVIKD